MMFEGMVFKFQKQENEGLCRIYYIYPYLRLVFYFG